MEDLNTVNWLAVGVGTIVAFLVGWAWFSPKMFGTKWAAGSNVELGTAASMPMFAMAAQLVGLFLLALVVGITATQDMLLTAIAAILAAAALISSSGAFAQKSSAAILIDFGYIVVAGVVMIAAQGIL